MNHEGLEGKGKTHSALTSLLLIINALALLGLIFGGMNFAIEISTNMTSISNTVKQITEEMNDMQKWKQEVEKRHYLEDHGVKPPVTP